MQDSQHNKIYIAEDIQQYLSGRLTPLQMNEMEKAALDDPFLAEAMEGYAAVEPGEWDKQLAEVRQALAKKQEGAKIIPINKKKNNWWKAAAAVLVIGGTATLSYFLVTKKQSDTIAQQVVPSKTTQQSDALAADSSALPATANTANGSITVNETAPALKEKKTIIKDLTRQPSEAAAENDFVYKPSPAGNANAPASAAVADDKKTEVVSEKTNEEAVNYNAAKPTENNRNNNYTVNTAPANNSQQGYDFLKKEAKSLHSETMQDSAVLNKTFLAQVLGPDNTPLPFANVNIKSENFGTYTDVKGVFRLISNDSVLYAEVKAAGYKPQVVTLKSNAQQNKIILQEDGNDFAEKVVISSSKNKAAVSKRAALVKDSVMNVEPADGWDNYNTYADNNFEIPDDILKGNIHGQVQLSFDVNNKGSITNIKVDKSLCSNCDEAAIRLLQQGPQWKIKKGKKGRGKITVQF